MARKPRIPAMPKPKKIKIPKVKAFKPKIKIKLPKGLKKGY